MKKRAIGQTSNASLARDAELLLEKRLAISANTRVPRSGARIRESTWSFYDSSDHEHVGHAPSLFTINWPVGNKPNKNGALEFTVAPLPAAIVHDLQTYAYILLRYYPLFALHKKGARYQIKTRSFVTTIYDGMCFLQWLIQAAKLRYFRVQTLADISIADIQAAAADYPYALNNRVTTFFSRLANPLVTGYLDHPLPFSESEVDLVNWKELFDGNRLYRDTINRGRRGSLDVRGNSTFLPLHPDLFVWLSNVTRADVADCLDAMRLTRDDHSDNPELQRRSANRNCLTDNNQFFPVWWATLVAAGSLPFGKRRYRRHIEAIDKALGIPVGTSSGLLRHLAHVRDGAQTLILQYTGMRSGSARSVMAKNSRREHASALRDINGFTMLCGINTKLRSSQIPADADKWLAIDCVRDAVRLIEALMPLHNNPYLFSAWKRKGNGKPKPRGDNALRYAICRYIAESDGHEQFVKLVGRKDSRRQTLIWSDGLAPSPIRFRHSLVAELARVDCGLPMITLQLKHVHSLFTGFSATTSGYGGIREQSIHRVKGAVRATPSDLKSLMDEKTTYSRTAREELYLAYFDPSRKFAGGGSDQHVSRLTEFFVGTGYSEEQKEQYIRRLANNGAPLVACGFGYCNKRYAEGDAVCKGDLCDPGCHNHVVTEVKIPIIQLRLRNCNEMLARPEQSHQRPKWERDKHVLEGLLDKLGVEPKADEV